MTALDALVLARFYSAVLGWELDEGASPIWAKLVPPKSITSGNDTDARPTLAFHAITDWVEPTWPGGEHPQQFHLDLSVDDIGTAEPSVLSAGARVHEHQPSTEGRFRVYVDPAGHPFCLIAR